MARDRRLFPLIRDLVQQVPFGEVASYGQIAFVISAPTPRVVGFAMAGLPDDSPVPWHRIINATGRVARRKDGGESPEQLRRLTAEGIYPDKTGHIDFASHAWGGPSWQWLEGAGIDPGELAHRSQTLKRHGPWCRWRF